MLPLSHLISHIPAQHRQKRAIDDAVLEFLAALPEAWEVRVQPGHLVRWWVVSIERARDHYRLAYFVDPDQQSPAGLVGGLRQAIQQAPVEQSG